MSNGITAVIIAKNSERTIADCVRALAFCDRVIVAENQSTDATQELAAKAGAEVRTVEWEGYGRTKNRLLDTIPEGWVLSIDADEVVTPALAEMIQEVTRREDAKSAYFLSRRNFFLGHPIQHCGWRPDWQLRLFRAGTARFEEKHVHEALVASGTPGYLEPPLDHFSYATVEEYLERMNRYTGLAAQDRLDRKKRPSALRILFDPGWTFFKMALIKQGWRDGFAGLALCALSALNTLVKHAKHWELARQRRP